MAEWQRGDVFKLINLYKERRLLWDPLAEDYKSRSKKHDSWRELDENLGVEEGECEKKMRKLVGQFQREFKKMATTNKFADEGKWIYFKSLMFLKDKHRPRSISETEIMDNLEPLEKVADQAADFRPPTSKVSKRAHLSDEVQLARSHFDTETKLTRPLMSTEMQLIAAAEKLANSSETKFVDSWEAFGLFVAGDLRNLESRQQTIAQKLISDVIYLAKLGRLSEGSVVTEPPTHFMATNIGPTPPLSNTSMSFSPYHEENSLPQTGLK